MTGNKNTYVLIMAGGVGSRFWPKSRNQFPKQFIDILGLGKSLLQLTYERFTKICDPTQIFILSNEHYKDLVLSQLPALKEDQVLLEPSRNNTAPCIAYASYKILKRNPDANIVVAPSDHLILKEDEFLNKVQQALSFSAQHDALLTLGIQPTRPDTGYGYIQYEEALLNEDGIRKVIAFKEKPTLEKAEAYLGRGEYLWNAGIFIWSARAIKEAFQKYAPDIDRIFTSGEIAYNTPEEKVFIREFYPKSPNISIDYAILENADNVYTLPADIGWSDLGTWASLHAVAEKDELENAVSCSEINIQQTQNCIIQLPKGKAAVIKGLDNFIVVDDGNVLLIYPKSDEQEIKQVAASMVEQYGSHHS